MKENTVKTKGLSEGQMLDLLKKVLPKATHDPHLAGQIYQAVEDELKLRSRATAFEKFCTKCELPNLEPKTVADVRNQLNNAFSDGEVTIKPNLKAQTLAVEVSMPDGGQFISEIKVRPIDEDASDEQEITLKYVPFPVCMPGDKELIWVLAKRESMSNEEAGVVLTKVEDEFWMSKTGQKLIRDRVERCFPEFVSRVPAGMLSEVGLKRHYKMPEPLKVVHQAPIR